MPRNLRTAVLCLAILIPAAIPARAIPAFAKMYKMNCTSCHSYYPRLNDFGEQFRRNGYKLPGALKAVTIADSRVLPVSADVVVASRGHSVGDQIGYTTGYLLSGAAMSSDSSYYLQYPAFTSWSSISQRSLSDIQVVNLYFTGLSRGGFNVRAGRFVPAYIAFAPSRELLLGGLVTNWLSYFSTTDGIEISKYGANGTSYYVGYASRIRPDEYSLYPEGYYARVARSFGGGLGQTKGHWIGLSAFSGRMHEQAYWLWPEDRDQEQPVTQVSADASLNFGRANLCLQLAKCRYSQHGSLDRAERTGRLMQLAYAISPKFYGVMGVQDVDYDEINSTDYMIGAGYYPAGNLALTAQYVLWKDNGGDPLSGHSLQLGLMLSY